MNLSTNGIRVLHLLVLGIAILPYFACLGDSSLWDANEAFYAETPREMLASGNFVIPLFNYTFRWQKPPLAYWGVCLSYSLFGVSEWAQRLPVALAAAAWIGLAYYAGSRWFSAQNGLLASLFLALNFRIFIMSRRAITEVWLAFFLSLALVLAAKALWDKGKSSSIWMAASWSAIALAVLTKGPVALVIFGATLLGSLLFRRDRNPPIFYLFFPGLLVFAAVVFPWYLRVIEWVGFGPIQTFLFSDNLGRYLSENFGPSRGLFYYLPVFFVDFAPWSILGLASLAFWLRQPKQDREINTYPPHLLFLLLWAGVVLALFSFSRNKQEYYIMPLYFPASLLFAEAWFRSAKELPWEKRTYRSIFLGIALLSVLIFPLSKRVLPELFQEFGIHFWATILLGVFLLAVATGLAWIAFRCSWNSGLALTLIFLWVCLLSAAVWILPAWERNRPVKSMALEIKKLSRPEDIVGYFRVAVPSLAFYLQRPIEELIDEKHFLQVILRRPGRKYFLMQEEDYKSLQWFLDRHGFQVLRKQELWRWRLQDLYGRSQDKNTHSMLLIANPGTNPFQGSSPVPENPY